MGRSIDSKRLTPKTCERPWNLNDIPLWDLAQRVDVGRTSGSKVFVSFGGLLLYMIGPYKKLTSLRHDHVYMLIKK